MRRLIFVLGVATALGLRGEWVRSCPSRDYPQLNATRYGLEFEWRGDSKERFTSQSQELGELLAPEADCRIWVPGRYPKLEMIRTAMVETLEVSGGPNAVIISRPDGTSWMVLLDESRPYSDRGVVKVAKTEGGFALSVTWHAAGYALPGVRQRVGDAWVLRGSKGADDLFSRLPEWYRLVGQKVPEDRPDWVRNAVVYSFDPRGTAADALLDRGGLFRAKENLGEWKALGINVIWLRPLEEGKPYDPDDYYTLDSRAGDRASLVEFVREAHRMGFKVWRDAVMHGGRKTTRRAKEHPEWLAEDENGTIPDYRCFDFYHPGWIEYFSKWVEYETAFAGLDGWRLDVPHGLRHPNWKADIGYARGSYAVNQGGLAQQRAIRAAARRVSPDAAILSESNHLLHSTVSDIIYDQELCHRIFPSMRYEEPQTFVPQLRSYLAEKSNLAIPRTIFLRYPESHDSKRAAEFYGGGPATALFALCAFAESVPLVFQEGEWTSFEAWRSILTVRARFPELRHGRADYLEVAARHGVLPIVRSGDGHRSVVYVNFNPEGVGPEGDMPHLGAYGWAVVRDGKLVEPEVKPFVRTAGKIVGLPVVRREEADGEVRIRVSSVDRWFADSADGRAEAPFAVRHPDFDRILPRRDGAVRWNADFHPFGFDLAHRRIGVVAGTNIVVFSGFSPDIQVRINDRIGDDFGFTVVVGGDAKRHSDEDYFFAVEACGADTVPRPVAGSGDDRLRQILGGWRFEDRKMRVEVLRNGALKGIWRKNGDAWMRCCGRADLIAGGGSDRLYAQSEEECPRQRFFRGQDGCISLEFSGALRHREYHTSRAPIIYRCKWTFGREDGRFAFELEYRNTKETGLKASFSVSDKTDALDWNVSPVENETNGWKRISTVCDLPGSD